MRREVVICQSTYNEPRLLCCVFGHDRITSELILKVICSSLMNESTWAETTSATTYKRIEKEAESQNREKIVYMDLSWISILKCMKKVTNHGSRFTMDFQLIDLNSGVILARGCSGCETTLWTIQKESIDKSWFFLSSNQSKTMV